MTAKEAYCLVAAKMSTMQIASCYEYDSAFVFQLVPMSMKKASGLLTGLTSVNKQNGVIRTFRPTDVSIEEYLRGRELSIAEYGGA